MTAHTTLEGLTLYEARALCMYIEVQNGGFLYHSDEKISVASAKRFPDGNYTLEIASPDGFPADVFGKELSGVRNFGHSFLDPERERVNTSRTTLPELTEFANIEIVSTGPVIKRAE
ncbi:MAG: hypothetical protein J0L97_03150 [Alphaproteobacteria bacterium]|nr:hypothetical protein [Alphaproteobacteria bacterium]